MAMTDVDWRCFIFLKQCIVCTKPNQLHKSLYVVYVFDNEMGHLATRVQCSVREASENVQFQLTWSFASLPNIYVKYVTHIKQSQCDFWTHLRGKMFINSTWSLNALKYNKLKIEKKKKKFYTYLQILKGCKGCEEEQKPGRHHHCVFQVTAEHGCPQKEKRRPSQILNLIRKRISS